MNMVKFIKEIGRGAKGASDLTREDAECLFAAMLDQQIDELQLGAILIGLRIKSESLDELLGFKAALDARTPPLQLNMPSKLVVIPSYNGARRQPNLTPLLALELATKDIPVLIHGRYDFDNRIDPTAAMQQLGIPIVHNPQQAEQALAQHKLAYIPLGDYIPELDQLLALRSRLGLRSCGHTMAKLLDPAPGHSLRLVSVTHPEYLEKMDAFLQADGGDSLLLRGTEGEVYANPRRCPKMIAYHNGQPQIAHPGDEGGAPPLAGIANEPGNDYLVELILRMRNNHQLPAPLLKQIAIIHNIAARLEK